MRRCTRRDGHEMPFPRLAGDPPGNRRRRRRTVLGWRKSAERRAEAQHPEPSRGRAIAARRKRRVRCRLCELFGGGGRARRRRAREGRAPASSWTAPINASQVARGATPRALGAAADASPAGRSLCLLVEPSRRCGRSRGCGALRRQRPLCYGRRSCLRLSGDGRYGA